MWDDDDEDYSSPYSLDINTDYLDSYQAQTNIVEDVLNGTGAVVVDFGTSVWNSLPGTDEVDTYEVLQRIAPNAAQLYAENQDTINTLSFVGGALVPGGAALKGMKMLRNGAKGADWFSTAGRAKQSAELDNLFRQGASARTQYNQMRRTRLAQNVGNEALDTAAMEMAVLASMSAHPFLEDYWENPLKNFAISMAGGTVFGSAIGAIPNRFAIRQMEGTANSEAWSTIGENLRSVHEGMPGANKLQMHHANIEMLEGLQKNADSNGLLKDLSGELLAITRAELVQDFEVLAKGLKDQFSNEQARAAIDRIAQDMRFQGVDKIDVLRIKPESGTVGYRALGQLKTSAQQTIQDFFNPKNQKIRTRAYSPEFDLFGTVGEIGKISRASAAGYTEASIQAGWRQAKDRLRAPRSDIAQELYTLKSVDVDADYLRQLSHIGKMDAAALKNLTVAPDDLPALNALVARAAHSADDLSDVRIRVTDSAPIYGQIATRILKANGVAADHHAKLLQFTNPQALRQYDLLGANAQLGRGATEMLTNWRMGSGVAALRQGADSFFRGGFGKNQALGQAFADIYNSPQAAAIRAKFKEQADADGHVYLWRGLSRNPKGHASIESYTTDIDKAREFGTPRLFKVHVDDIVGAIADIPGSSGVWKNEILVGAPARQMEAVLPVSQSAAAGAAITGSKQALPVQELSLPEVASLLLDKKEAMLTSMLKRGIPMEVMSIRSNVPYETVQAWTAAGGSRRLYELSADGLPTASYANAAELGTYLNPELRLWKLQVSEQKVPYVQMSANLDRRALGVANREIVSAMLETSNSTTARKVQEFFFGQDTNASRMLDILRSQVGNAVEGFAGNKFLQSGDFFTRNMKDFGPIATHIGKQVTHIANQAIKENIKPVTELMAKVATDRAALVEFNQAYALNAGLRGYREYREGQFWIRTKQLNEAGEEVDTMVPARLDDGREFKVVSEDVDKLLQEVGKVGQELFALKNTSHRVQGIRDMNSLGYWMPPFNPKGKHIAFVHNNLDQTRLLTASTAEGLDQLIASYSAAKKSALDTGAERIIKKGMQEYENIFIGRLDQINMTMADVGMRHGGSSAPAIVPATTEVFGDMVQAYEHYFNASIRNLAELSMSDITDTLVRMGKVADLATKNQPLTRVQQLVGAKQNTPMIMRNMLLGVSDLGNNATWQSINQSFDTVLGVVGNQMSKLWRNTGGALLKKNGGKAEALNALDYKAFSEQAAKLGMVNPYSVYDEAAAQMLGVASLMEAKNSSSRAIYASNALAATSALRFGEVAQPLVNAMSLPILMMSGIADRMPASFMGITKGTAKVQPAQIMYEGLRASLSKQAQFQGWAKRWQDAGYFDPMVSEASDALMLSRKFEPGLIAATERAVNSGLVRTLSTPADWSETQVRKVAMFTGGVLAKRMYPELGDAGITVFARHFMDRVIGNYHAAQRPTMFQGSLGTAMGLFQTYMVTMAQNMYRHLELKNHKALAKTMLLQGGVFGAASLPGFNLVSELIGEHFSDDNYDLITGTYRALPNGMADLLIYGLPSNLGPAFYSRGELAPRVPTGIGEFPAVSMLGQAFDAVWDVSKAIGQTDETAGRALAQALSMQSINRPIARMSEIASGYSVTRQGNTIASPEEVWTATGIIARLLSTRPLEEAKLRDSIHLNTVYGSLDREARQKVVAQLKTAIRSDALTDAKLEELAEEYMRTGTPTGWRSALNTAIATTEMSGKTPFQKKLQMDNPLNHLIDSLDGWE